MSWQVDVPETEEASMFEVEAVAAEVDPRKLYEAIPVDFDEVGDGDWIAAQSWSRPRRVELVEYREGGKILFLAEPDESRCTQPGVREVNHEGWEQRGSWTRFPYLRTLWDLAHR